MYRTPSTLLARLAPVVAERARPRPGRRGRLLASLAVLAVAGALSGDEAPRTPTPAANPASQEVLPAPPPAAHRKKESRPEKPAPPAIRPLPTPDEAVALALADALTLSPLDRPYARYLWNRDEGVEALKADSLAVNYVSRASAVVRPVPVADGRLARIDLRAYAPRDEDLVEWLKLWEEFQFDPAFSLLITRDEVELLDLPREQLPKVRRERKVSRKVSVGQGWRTETRSIVHRGGRFDYPDDSGRFYPDLEPGTYRPELRFKVGPAEREIVETVVDEVSILDAKDFDVVRVNGRHINPGNLLRLQELTGTQAPVVEHRYFKTRALTTIKDQGVFKVVFGGLYYDLRGIRKAKDVLGRDTKATDEDLFFESLGVGSIKAGVNAAKVFDRLRSDQRLAVFRSGVTGKPRRVDMFHTLAGKETTGWGAITHDIRDEDVDVGAHPVMNLVDFVDFAREGIFEGANGFHLFVLFNKAGALQNEVPPQVAAARNHPPPHTTRLQGAIDCIWCHGTDGSDGWKPLTNDVKRLLGRRPSPDVVADFSDRRKDAFGQDVIDRVTGLYAGDFTKHLRRARDDLAEATLKATGPWPKSRDQADAARRGAQRLADDYEAYNFRLVDARAALAELGFDVPPDYAARAFQALLPPDPRARVDFFILEDPRIAALGQGLSINRADWALVYGFAAERVRSNRFLSFLQGASQWSRN